MGDRYDQIAVGILRRNTRTDGSGFDYGNMADEIASNLRALGVALETERRRHDRPLPAPPPDTGRDTG